jgi:choline dehydrogenase-like flavoprotein
MNIIDKKARTYDAIVIGSGISGGWAAKELTDKGLKTLVLERGRNVKHIEDYPTTMHQPWDFPHREAHTVQEKTENPIASKCYAFDESSKHFFAKDADHPYIQDKPFDWIRGYQVGGKSLLWARQTQRWSKYDFEGPARDGYATPWAITYNELAPWYSHVERFAGISGNRDGIDTLPDGVFLKPHDLTCVEKHWSEQIKKKYGASRHLIIGRAAHLTDPQPIHTKQGRAQCQNRTICERGCPYGGYFSSNASTLPWAMKSGKMTLRPDSVVHSIIYDEKLKKATGVRVVDANTKEMVEYYAKIIFLNAAALNSNLILLNSTSNRFPNGLGNDSGVLGKYIAFHNYRGFASGEHESFKEFTTGGKRPNLGYIPRFRNVYKHEEKFLRGYATGMGASRVTYSSDYGIGQELLDNLAKTEYGNWRVDCFMQGETIPKETNTVYLDKTLKDAYGMPLLHTNVSYDTNDELMITDFKEQMEEMLQAAGFVNIRTGDNQRNPGLDIHEMGGVRMGIDPKTSMLNKFSQLHHCKNVFVTDGSSMASTSTQNPSLTYMAFTARAANYAVQQLKALKL